MAFGSGTVRDVGGAVNDIFSSRATASSLRLKAQGDIVEGQNYDLASQLARQNAQYEEMATKVKAQQIQRQQFLGIGTERADIAGAGLTMSGSALDLLRDSAGQGALQKQVVTEQGQITEAGYNEQATAYSNLATYAKMAASEEQSQAKQALTAGWVSAGFKIASAITGVFSGGGGGGGGGDGGAALLENMPTDI